MSKKIRDKARNLWNWMGEQKNHNALVVILMITVPIFVLLGGVYFETQISQIKSSIEELYNRQVVESFSYEDIKMFNPNIEAKGPEDIGSIEIILKDKPIPNSITFWFGGMIQNPIEYTVNNKSIDLKLYPAIGPEYFEGLQEHLGDVVVIMYTKSF